MQPEILTFPDKTCLLIYDYYLVVNLPVKKVEQCVEALAARGEYKNKRLVLVEPDQTRLYDLKSDFNVYYYPNDDKVVLDDKKSLYHIPFERVIGWLGPRLKQKGFTPKEQELPKSGFIIMTLICIVLGAIVGGFLYYQSGTLPDPNTSLKFTLAGDLARFLGPGGSIIAGVVVAIICAGWAIYKIRTNPKALVYSRLR